ncbi:hypothetical protein BC832DRAFT_367159 [Gaertneriomyces semiglobifer]|nr:hypothetical protein BC832DRAFT_367159 [Gaertneriomyces semiglobifer]
MRQDFTTAPSATRHRRKGRLRVQSNPKDSTYRSDAAVRRLANNVGLVIDGSPKKLASAKPFAIYPCWWGHREAHTASNDGEDYGDYHRVRDVECWKCPKRMVDEITQTFDPMAMNTSKIVSAPDKRKPSEYYTIYPQDNKDTDNANNEVRTDVESNTDGPISAYNQQTTNTLLDIAEKFLSSSILAYFDLSQISA